MLSSISIRSSNVKQKLTQLQQKKQKNLAKNTVKKSKVDEFVLMDKEQANSELDDSFCRDNENVSLDSCDGVLTM